MSTTTPPILLKKTEVCARLAISKRTLENMVNAREFPPGRAIGKYVYWTEACLTSWVRRYFSVQEAWKR
jgi:predicted DNA-binding transcriptional regulator AlpA